MNERAAKFGAWGYLLLTAAALALSAGFFLFLPNKSQVALIGLPLWMGYTVFNLIKTIADMIGRRQRIANFTRMLDRWQDALGGRVQALLLLAFMTLAVGGVKLAIPFILIQL